MRTKTFAVAGALILLNSCAPSTNFQRVFPGISLPKSDTATVATVSDPPGQPYQLLGIVAAAGESNWLGGGSMESVTQSLKDRAREEGADAILLASASTTSQTEHYDEFRSGSTVTRRINTVTAYAIRWKQPQDEIAIPGTTTVASIVAHWMEQQKQGEDGQTENPR